MFEWPWTCARCHHHPSFEIFSHIYIYIYISTFLGFADPFFPEKVWNVRHAESFCSEKKGVLCMSTTAKIWLKHKTKNFRCRHPHHICADLCSLIFCVLTTLLPWPDDSSVVWVPNQDGGKKPNYLLAWCLSAKLLIFSTAYFKEASRHSTLWVFTLKLKECFTNWQEVVHFN